MKHYQFVFVGAILFAASAQGQVLNRLKQRVENRGEQKAGEAIDKLFNGKKNDSNNGNQSGQNGAGNNGQNGSGSGTGGTSNNASNRGGAGLISTPPDVKKNLTDAEVSYKKSSFGEARYAVQQAMLGVELEIGNQILNSLPETVVGLAKRNEDDQVTSTGYGWAGLTIQRMYADSKEKELEVVIANNAAWMTGINAYLSMGYAQQTNGTQNWKQTKLKSYRAIIEYSDGSGYKLSVPLGQSSIIIFNGVNFATEPEMMKACENFNIDGIKKQLGEQ